MKPTTTTLSKELNYGDKVMITNSRKQARNFDGNAGVVRGFKGDQVVVELENDKSTWLFWKDELKKLSVSVEEREGNQTL